MAAAVARQRTSNCWQRSSGNQKWEAHETNDPTDPIGNISILKRFLSTLSMAMLNYQRVKMRKHRHVAIYEWNPNNVILHCLYVYVYVIVCVCVYACMFVFRWIHMAAGVQKNEKECGWAEQVNPYALVETAPCSTSITLLSATVQLGHVHLERTVKHMQTYLCIA